MPRKSFERLPAERRLEILRTAAESFAAHGYHGTSLNQLLSRLGIGKGSAYHYFEDKADLFQTAVLACYDRYFASLSELEQPADAIAFWQFVEAANYAGFRFMLDDPTAALLMQCFAREASSFEHVLASDTILAALDEHHRRVIELGQRLGAVRRDAPMERLSLLSRTLAAAGDQEFIAAARREGVAAVRARLPEFAAAWTAEQRRSFEARPEAAKSSRKVKSV